MKILLWMSVLLAGLSLAIACWVCLLPGRHHDRSTWPEGAHRGILAWCWPWIATLAQCCRPFLPWRWRAMMERRMGRAGLVHRWAPEHLTAIQLWLGLMALAIVLAFSWQASWTLKWSVGTAMGVAVLSSTWPLLWLASRQRERLRVLQRELPFFLDLLTLCVEAGQSLQGALQQAVGSSPQGPLMRELAHVLAQLRTGVSRAEAFDALAERTGLPALRLLALTLRQADHFGMSMGPILRAQATQQRDERFLRAEKMALEAPVKMLFPLVCCIFPCTFLIIGFPLVAGFLDLT